MSDDVRDRIRQGLDARLDEPQLDALFGEVLALKKQARGWCKECKHAVFVEIPDAKAVTSALTDLANQAWGTPGRAADPEPEPTDVYTEADMTGLDRETLVRLAGFAG